METFIDFIPWKKKKADSDIVNCNTHDTWLQGIYASFAYFVQCFIYHDEETEFWDYNRTFLFGF